MQIFVKKLNVEGSFFDCLRFRDFLYLWNIEGEQRVYDWKELFERRNLRDNIEVSSIELSRYLLKVTDVPGKSLSIDTNQMNGRIYVATSEGVYRTDAFGTYEAQRREHKKARKIWDARLFYLNRHPQSPLMSMSAGDDGLYELNESAFDTIGLKKEENNIFKVNDKPSHQSEYINASIGSWSRGDSYMAKFYTNRQGKGHNVRQYVGLDEDPMTGLLLDGIEQHVYDNQLGELIQRSIHGGIEIIEYDDGLLVYHKRDLLLKISEPVVKWRIYSNKGVHTMIILLDDRFEVYQSEILTEERDEEKDNHVISHAKDIILRLGRKYPDVIGNENTAIRLLRQYVKNLRGVLNIDFIDYNNWDEVREIKYDKHNKVVYIIKDWPRRYVDKEDEMMYRAIHGMDDCMVVAFKLGGVKIYKDNFYPFVTMMGKRIATSKQKFLLKREFGKIVQTINHPFCNEYRVQGNAFVYNIMFYHTEAVSGMMMGKDIGWDSSSSGKALTLLTLDLLKNKLYECARRTANQIEKIQNGSFVDEREMRKGMKGVQHYVTEMMRLELECRMRDTCDYDQKTEFGILKMAEIIKMLVSYVDDSRRELLISLYVLSTNVSMDEKKIIGLFKSFCLQIEVYWEALDADLQQSRYRKGLSEMAAGDRSNTILKSKTLSEIIEEQLKKGDTNQTETE